MSARHVGWALALLLAACGGRTSPLAASDADAGVDTPAVNACGGSTPLMGAPMTPCGECGLLRCDGTERLRCDDDGMRNACGECGPLPEEMCNGRDDDCDDVTDEGCVLRAATLRSQETFVRVSGDRLVADSQGTVTMEDVVLVDLTTFELRHLTPHPEPPDFVDPSPERRGVIDGELVAWLARGREVFRPEGELVAYDLTAEREVVLPMLGVVGGVPAVDAGRVAVQSRFGRERWDVVVIDAASGGLTRLDVPATHEMAPDLSGDWIVFERAPEGGEIFERHVFARRLSTGEERALSDGLEGWHVAPAIDGDRVVWHREQGSSAPSREGDVFLYDLRTGERRMLSRDGVALNARISEDLVCWSTTAQLNSGGGIWSPGGVTVHDLATGRQDVVAPEAHLCDVDGLLRRVVWLARRGNLDPYVYDLAPDEP